MEIIERHENRYVLEPLKQYLENEGIQANIQVEWLIGKKRGPYVLCVEDELYEEAIRALDNIDKTGIDDGLPVTTKSGETTEQIKERYDMWARWVARIFLVLMIAALIYIVWKY